MRNARSREGESMKYESESISISQAKVNEMMASKDILTSHWIRLKKELREMESSISRIELNIKAEQCSIKLQNKETK